jgi:LysR family hydrogen peroxide-inducible transcriptional activator
VLTLPVYEEPFVVLLPASHPLSARDEIEVADLRRENVLLLGAGHCFRDQVLEVCPECLPRSRGDSRLPQAVEGGSLETIRYMVAGGLGITILPCTAAGADRFSQRLVTIRRFAGEAPTRRVALAWRKSFPRPRAVDALRLGIQATQLSCVRPIVVTRGVQTAS